MGKNKPEEKKKKKKKPEEAMEKMPFCTSAPSAEHHRAHDEDEPCDDGRVTDADE